MVPAHSFCRTRHRTAVSRCNSIGSRSNPSEPLSAVMYVGDKDEVAGSPVVGWLDYPDYQSATDAGASIPGQNIGMLEDVVKLAVDGAFELIDDGRLDPKQIDWWVTHYSSHIFKEQAYELFCRGGLVVPLDRVFTNLYTKGNVGSASPYIMLEELF
ncbi:MAG: hypothetical protein Ct9H300mP1_30200 [Planctomycetaceae bacterium]|nr:MAG: hypothetical protein Ct9H300mP1_30200 [Planctomycetaceae bacterium]